MTTETNSIVDYRRREATNRLGLWLFLLSDLFVFGGLFVARFYLLGLDTRPELNQVLGLVITSILLLSSYFMYTAETAIRFGETKKFLRNVLITLVLGVVFLVGVVGLEWQIAPAGPDAGVVWSIFYIMTGFHAFHVLTGVIFLFIVYRNGRKGRYSAERHWAVEAAAVYWHFVDVIWIFFYPALYLIGLPAG